jgi:hypothetical protein
MKTTAKVALARKEEAGDDQFQLTFSADYADERNKEWAKYTPYLNLVMTVKSTVADHFQLGDRFTLVFEPEES